MYSNTISKYRPIPAKPVCHFNSLIVLQPKQDTLINTYILINTIGKLAQTVADSHGCAVQMCKRQLGAAHDVQRVQHTQAVQGGTENR